VKLITAAVVALLSSGEAGAPPSAPTGSPPPPPGAAVPAAPLPGAATAPAPAAAAITLALPAQLARIDELHQRRDERAAWTEEQQLVHATLARAPNDYGVLWRAARVFFWLSDDPYVTNDQRSKWGQQGWDLAERAIAVNPNDVAGHYWATVCMGNYALGLGVMKALAKGMEGKFKTRLKRAGELNPQYQHGSIDVAWGRFYDKLPWPKRDRQKAQEHFRTALQAHPYNLRAKVFLAVSLMDDDHPADAKRLLDEVAAAQPGKYDPPEERRAKVLGARLMPELIAKLK
jgi:tetratricopeptide (TPR) repeat protein